MPFKVEVLCPAFRRPEYTAQCIKALEEAQPYDNCFFHLWDDGSCDGTDNILRQSSLNKRVVVNPENMGLRNILINFLEIVNKDTEFIAVVGNDCLMPKNWLNDMLAVFAKSDADILSPDVNPSHAALRLGRPDEGQGYMPSDYVGGLWFMKRSMIEGMSFERYPKLQGINGAFEILKQIIMDKEPKIGWVPSVVVEDIGHWSGTHPLCLKSDEHREYYAQVNRRISW
jgi:GT2 family glycosyltransferase